MQLRLVNRLFCIGVFYSLLACNLSHNIPQAEIRNSKIKAKLYLPDVNKGYYQGTRFDWSGIIPKLTYDGHSYFGKWFKKYNPKTHDAVMGPVDSFLPIGYDLADVGETFLIIGVGELIKEQDAKYNAYKTYKIGEAGNWEIHKEQNQITFKHILNTSKYTYEYIKTITLPEGKSHMIIDHTLVNKGSQLIETKVFNHNFFFIDNDVIGPGYVVKFPYKIISEGNIKGLTVFAEIRQNELHFINKLGQGDQVYLENIKGYEPNLGEYNINIENRNTGAGVSISGDKSLSKLLFWSTQKAICPEPYIDLKIAPRESFNWKIIYEFYNC